LGIEPDQALRAAVLAVIRAGGEIGSARRGVRARLVGEALQPAGACRVGAATVRDEPAALDLTGRNVDDVEPRLARRQRKIDDAYTILVDDLRRMFAQRGKSLFDEWRQFRLPRRRLGNLRWRGWKRSDRHRVRRFRNGNARR